MVHGHREHALTPLCQKQMTGRVHLTPKGYIATWKASSMTVCMMIQDARDPNPLIRALAVRTMGCIRVDKITEYLCDPLQLCLKVGCA